jgi:hypothetical protein
MMRKIHLRRWVTLLLFYIQLKPSEEAVVVICNGRPDGFQDSRSCRHLLQLKHISGSHGALKLILARTPCRGRQCHLEEANPLEGIQLCRDISKLHGKRRGYRLKPGLDRCQEPGRTLRIKRPLTSSPIDDPQHSVSGPQAINNDQRPYGRLANDPAGSDGNSHLVV